MPYAHPESLVETEWLAAHLDDPDIRVVDASFKLPGITPTAREDYDRGHIPGAVFFDIDDIAEPGTSLPHMIPSPELFARKMEGLGIGDDDRVIVYDSAGLSSAGRAWWMLRLFGHHNVALLDGGLPKWKAEGRPLETAVPNPPRRRFSARFDPALVRDKRALLDNLSTRREQVVDARAAGRFAGIAEETRPWLAPGPYSGAAATCPTTGSPIRRPTGCAMPTSSRVYSVTRILRSIARSSRAAVPASPPVRSLLHCT